MTKTRQKKRFIIKFVALYTRNKREKPAPPPRAFIHQQHTGLVT